MINRRDFFTSRQLAHAAGHVLGAANDLEHLTQTPEQEPSEPTPETLLVRASRRAMATTFEIALPFGTPDALSVAEAALDEIDRLEAQLTVYRDDSEVSTMNRSASSGPVRVSAELIELLQLAARLTTETQGAFDVAAGALVNAWGFFRGPRRVPSTEERSAALRAAGMRNVVLDALNHTVRYCARGLQINLGSIGKGYALDRAAQILMKNRDVRAGLLHAGHSSVYAMGKEPATGQGWRVALRHPWQAGERLGTVTLCNCALGTSAATFQHLDHYGRKLGHILDPRTGWPAEGIASASVIAPTAAEADALATAFFILGVEASRNYCARRPEVGAVLLPEGEKAMPVVLGSALFEFTPHLPGLRPA
jgi:thiamine biosynthesis lipoprotein